MAKIALVVPTIREDQIKQFLIAWSQEISEAGVQVYVVEDNAQKIFSLADAPDHQLQDLNVVHMCHADAPDGMLECVNVKSPCCRQIGFYRAFLDDNEVIVTIDDDVRPVGDTNLFTEYYTILKRGVPLWVDPLLNYRSRGYPVENVGNVKVVFHVGSFLKIPDVDGQTQLEYEGKFATHPPRYIPRATIVPLGQLIPVNGGICGFVRELTPYVHYTNWSDELGYRRFDDIWMGIILKRVLDNCGLSMSYGQAFVNHIRASNAERNTKLERKGKAWNEVFWERLDRKLEKSLSNTARTLRSTYTTVAETLTDMKNNWAQEEGTAMVKWLSFFD